MQKGIKLITKADKNHGIKQNQEYEYDKLQERFSKRNLSFRWEFSPIESFHDRKILFNNGLEISLGKGLDIYQPADAEDESDIGYYDLDFRKCWETTINIFRLPMVTPESPLTSEETESTTSNFPNTKSSASKELVKCQQKLEKDSESVRSE